MASQRPDLEPKIHFDLGSPFSIFISGIGMELASRILSVLLGLAVIVFVLWPVTVPLGFGEVWWASRQAQRSQTSELHPQGELALSPAAQEDKPLAPPQGIGSEPPAGKPASVQAPAPAARNDSQAPSPHAVAPPHSQVPPEQVAALPENKAEDAPPQAATKTYYRVKVRDGGTIEAGSVVIRLAGITAREANATCQSERGKTWPCGAAVRSALVRLIRGRAVTCGLPKTGEHNIMEIRCSVGGTDLSGWMVRQGWAEPKDRNENALVQAAAAAKAEKLGLWRASH